MTEKIKIEPAKKPLICVWNMGIACKGEVKIREIFEFAKISKVKNVTTVADVTERNI